MFDIGGTLLKLVQDSGFAAFFAAGGWKSLIMIVVACVLLYLGIVKQFEPLLLVGIAFGCLLTNLPGANMYNPALWDAYINGTPFTTAAGEVINHMTFTDIIHEGGLLDVFYIGVKGGVYPSLIFMGVGAMTDFGPLISNPKSLLLGAAAQLGVFVAFFGAICLGFTGPEAASIGIIGGADGPTAIYLTTKLAPHLLGAIAIAAYSYMALIPLIQPPIMKLLTTQENRKIKMEQTREVSKTEKIVFPIIVSIFVILLLPSTAPADRLPDARQPVPGVRRHGASFRHRAERPHEHRHDLPRDLRRRDDRRVQLPHPADPEDRLPGPRRVLHLHGRRHLGRQRHVRPDPQEGQPADRLRRRLRGPHGRARLADRRSEGEPRQLPVDARHGPERGRRHRLRHRRGLPARRVRLIPVSAKAPLRKGEALFCARNRPRIKLPLAFSPPGWYNMV
jgi:hypothetical protein